MNDSSTKLIWNPQTGITGLEGNASTLNASEIPGIRAIWSEQRTKLAGSAQLLNFTEKLSREWAIETGIIENLYEIERGVTLTLIERGFQADLLDISSTNKPREYVIQLLKDQKDALDGIFDFVKSQRSLSTSYIKELHAALLRSQEITEAIDAHGHYVEIPLIKGNWKTQPNSPVRDGITYTYCSPEQVASEMDRLVSMFGEQVTQNVSAEVQAAWFHHRFTQIHPFQDGNGRVARAIASLILVKDGLFPLVVRRDDKLHYLDALEAADQGDLKPLITLFAKLQRVQFVKATAISEVILAEDNVQAMLGGLRDAASNIATKKQTSLGHAYELANALQANLFQRLRELEPDVLGALNQIDENASVFVRQSASNTDHYYRAQIIENAKKYLNYFAYTSDYRAWVALNMQWSRRAQLVFAIHGIGKPFNGSLICAPFLEFRDYDEEQQARSNLIPVTDEGFVFFFNEDSERLLSRFNSWREDVLKISLKELTMNL